MWTTELHVSATVTSLRLATCALFVCQVSRSPIFKRIHNLSFVSVAKAVATVWVFCWFFLHFFLSSYLSILQLQPHLHNLRVSVWNNTCQKPLFYKPFTRLHIWNPTLIDLIFNLSPLTLLKIFFFLELHSKSNYHRWSNPRRRNSSNLHNVVNSVSFFKSRF